MIKTRGRCLKRWWTSTKMTSSLKTSNKTPRPSCNQTTSPTLDWAWTTSAAAPQASPPPTRSHIPPQKLKYKLLNLSTSPTPHWISTCTICRAVIRNRQQMRGLWWYLTLQRLKIMLLKRYIHIDSNNSLKGRSKLKITISLPFIRLWTLCCKGISKIKHSLSPKLS